MLPYPVYIWDGALGEWVDHGNLRGVGIQKIEQISSSMDSLGANVIRVTLDDGSFYDYTVRNGDRGPAGSIWIGTSAPPDDSYSIWLNPSGVVSGFVGANQGTENAGRVLAVGEDGAVVPREETQPDYTQNDATKPDFIKNRPGGYYGEQKTYKLDISAVKQDGIDELTVVGVLQDDFIHNSSINVEISHSSGTINRTLTQREIGPYIINEYGAQIYGNAHLIKPSQPDTGEDMALYKEADSSSNYSIGWHVWATSVPSGDVEVCVVEKTMNAVPFDPVFIPWDTSPTKDAVLYTAQSLTEAQKAQARANIGAGTPYTLPEASPDALGGVKADAAETADTQPVRIGGDGKLYTAPGGGGASEWTLFQEGITDADVSGFEFDGVGDYTEFLFLGSWVKGSGKAGLSVKMNDAYALTVGNYFVHDGQAKNVSVELILMERKRFSLRGLSQQQNSTQYNIDELGAQSIYNIPQGIETPITKISFYSSNTSVQIPAGATYALYVR